MRAAQSPIARRTLKPEGYFPAEDIDTGRALAIFGTASGIEKVRSAGLRELTAPVRLTLADTATTECALLVLDRLSDRVTRRSIERLIVVLPLPPGCDAETIFARLVVMGIKMTLIDTEAEAMAASSPFLSGLQRVAKGLLDRAGAAFLLLLLLPLLLAVAALISLTSPGPPIFVQPRLGRNNTVIQVLKFRTMYVERADRLGGNRTVPNDPRVTRLGRMLRRWSIDELPQLANVLIGNMSLIGPRPHAVLMTAGERLYFEAVPGYLRRHVVKPGITGWAQVNGLSGEVASAEAGAERLAYDLHYIANWSIWLDIRILWKTLTIFADRAHRY